MGVTKGDTRSFDSSSYGNFQKVGVPYIPSETINLAVRTPA